MPASCTETRLQALPLTLFEKLPKENTGLEIALTSDKSDQCDSDSDLETVIWYEASSERESNSLPASPSTGEKNGIISDTASVRSCDSDGSFKSVSDTFSDGKSDSSSIGSDETPSVDGSGMKPADLCNTAPVNELDELHPASLSDEAPSRVSNGTSDIPAANPSECSADEVFDALIKGELETSFIDSRDLVDKDDNISEPETVILCDTSSADVPSNVDSPDSSREKSVTVPNASSVGPLKDISDTFVEGKLPDASPIDNCDTVDQDDCISEPETVILCDTRPADELSNFDASSSSHEEPIPMSDTASDDSSDISSQAGSDTFSNGGSDTSSICSSVDTDTDSGEEERPRGSRRVAAYASSVRDGRRIRNSCDSIHDTGRWHVEPDGFINEMSRAGGPYLYAQPVHMLTPKGSDDLWDIFRNFALNKAIISTLDQYNINPDKINIFYCTFEWNPEPQRKPTLVITATRDKFSNTWLRACRELHQLLSDNGFGDVNVEIADPAGPFRVWRVDQNEPLDSRCREIFRLFYMENDPGDILLTSAIRIGTSENREDSEYCLRVTVCYKSNRDWRDARETFVSILDALNLSTVGVLITTGCTFRGCTWR
jgi:hypothetical protein